MKKVILTVVSAICVSFIISQPIFALSDTPHSFYCVRNKEHKQPRLGTELEFIQNYNAYYVDKKHGDSSEDKVVYLTFDAGYENGNIENILNVLKAEDVKGAFFILKNLIDKNPELVIRMSNEGHTVGNHTSRHRDMTKIDDIKDFNAELEELNKAYMELTNKTMPSYYRPPEGKFDERSLSYASDMGYKTVFWSFAYADWDNDHQPDADAARKKILDNIHNGAVILLHPTSATNAKILSDVIKALKEQGYRFGELSELCVQ